MSKGKAIEITIEEDPVEEELKPLEQYYSNGELCACTDYEIRIVRLSDDDATVVETTFTKEPSFVPRWLRYVDRDHRKRRAPNLLSIAFCTAVGRPSWPYDGPPRFKCPIRVASLCVGGSHCLVYDVGNINSNWERVEMLKYNPLRRLLEDRRISVVGIGMKRFAAQAREEWGVHVANPVELRSLMGEAVGEGKIWSEKFGVEEMGEVVLAGLKMKEKPKRIKEMDWGREEITEEMLMYATRDAYLAFEVGKKCLEMIGRKI